MLAHPGTPVFSLRPLADSSTSFRENRLVFEREEIRAGLVCRETEAAFPAQVTGLVSHLSGLWLNRAL